jgi:hypothetical protein
MNGRDPAADALASLQCERWQGPEHAAELLLRLERQERRAAAPRRWPLLAAGALLGGVVTAATVTAADGWRWLARLFAVRVVDVDRDGAGEIRRLTLEDERGRLLLLRPVDGPVVQVVEVEREGGGTLRLRVLQEGDLGLVLAFAAIGSDTAPEPGRRLVLRQITPERFRATFRGTALAITSLPAAGPPRTVVLEPVPGRPGCYSDGAALLEVVE